MGIPPDDGDFLRKSLGGGYRLVGSCHEARMVVCWRGSANGSGRIPVDDSDLERHDDPCHPDHYLRASGVRVGSLPLLALGVEAQRSAGAGNDWSGSAKSEISTARSVRGSAYAVMTQHRAGTVSDTQ